MTLSALCTIGAAICPVWAATTFVLITANLDRRGIKTNWPLMRWYSFRNLGLYGQETLRASRKVGPLVYGFVVSINAVWILVLLAFAFS